MISILLFAALTAVAIGLVLAPLFRRKDMLSRNAFDLNVHRDQLAELERDRERGLIQDAEARAAKLEIERKILALASKNDKVAARRTIFSNGVLAPVLLALMVPALSGLIYVQLGAPSMPDQPLAARRITPDQTPENQRLLAEIERLEGHLSTTPDNGGIWQALGRTQLRLGDTDAAINAFSRALDLTPDDPSMRGELGEALVYAAGGTVTPAAVSHFEEALELAPNEPRARYYLGLSLAQEGQSRAAIESWSDLLAKSPPDAPWRPHIIEGIRSVVQETGGDVAAALADLPRGTGPSAADQAAMSALPEDEQSAQIRAMVDGLAERLETESDDIEGWLQLGRSRLVLGEPDAAKAAYQRAMELAPDRADVLKGYASTLLQPGASDNGDPLIGEEARKIYRQLADKTPNDLEPHWLLGIAAVQNGEPAEAVGHWRTLLGLLDPGSDDYAAVEARIAMAEGRAPEPAQTSEAAPSGEALPRAQAEASSGPEPTAADRAEMAALAPDERNGRIRGMVDGLAARLADNPDDIEGWLRLAQSRLVLGEPEAAKEAYRRALELDPQSIQVMKAYAASLLGDQHPETSAATVSEEAASLYRKAAKADPSDPEVQWYLGLAAVQDGALDEAAGHWRRVLDLLGPEHPNYDGVQASLRQVEEDATRNQTN